MRWLIALLSVSAMSLSSEVTAQAPDYFAIQVLDSQSGRGVPLVKLRANNQDYYTDSNGLVAFNTPGMVNQSVTFLLTSYGYVTGIWPLQTTLGTTSQVTLNRLQPAERLYRVTGKGIYQDTVLLGQNAPIDHPLLNANVKGQDSVQTTIHNGQVYWFWGDTLYDVGFGNFRAAGATSQLPGQGGLSPSQGINLNYFVDGNGSAKQMMPLQQAGPVWLDGLFTVDDNAGQERMLAHYSRRDPNNALGAQVEHGLSLYNDMTNVLERHETHGLDNPITAPGLGHAFKQTVDGQDYIYFAPLLSQCSRPGDVGRCERCFPVGSVHAADGKLAVRRRQPATRLGSK